MELAVRREGIAAKLQRAAEHLLDLTQEEAKYIVTEEYGPTTTIESSIPERQGQRGLACRAYLRPDPPARIGVICGDIVHNLRSALDHLANALVIANGGIPKDGPRGTQFPIRLGGSATIDARAGGISEGAQRLLAEVQPRHESDSLATLARLSNIDKHRTLNVIVVDLGDLGVFDVPPELEERLRVEDPPWAHGELIYSIVPLIDEDEPFWHGVEYSGVLAFEEFERKPVVSTLRSLSEFVSSQVVQRFAACCLGGSFDV